MNKRGKKAGALFLSFAILFQMVFAGNYVKAADGAGGNNASESKEIVTVVPFPEQWKYYGQKREFQYDINYATSNDEPLSKGVSLKLEEESIGKQKFCIEDLRSEDEKKEVTYELEKDSPLYEIKEYITAEKAEDTKHIYNGEDKKKAEEESGDTVVSGSAVSGGSDTMKVQIQAPKDFLIAPSLEGEESQWKQSMEAEIKEGDNTFTYYLRSNLNDATRKAIDQTPKTITLKADWTAPAIVSLSGGGNSTDVWADGQITASEQGTFYYAVVPETHAELTREDIETNVGAHYGIVGQGRVDGTQKATEFSFQGLAASKNYVIYAYVEDDAGNVSPVQKSEIFTTDRMALAGTVEVTGTMAVEQVLTAKVNLDSVAAGELTYQWYRIKNKEDESSLDEVWDETGGADEDDLEAEDDDDEDDEDDDLVELDARHKFAANSDDAGDKDDAASIEGATLIKDATQSTYKTTREDIGHRLICCVSAEKYSGYIAGETTTYIPKLLPEYTLPSIAAIPYSPKFKLSSITLPERWSWVDNTITPVYGNSGYRAKYIPEDTTTYKTIIVRIKIPVNKRQLKKSMIQVPKTRAYAGTAIKDNFYVEDMDDELTAGSDFSVKYKNNKKPGKATITFRGKGNYKGAVKVTYKIKKRSVKRLTYKFSKTKVYNGKTRTAGVVIKNGKVRLVKDRDYTIAYKNNKEMGKAGITIKGKGYYYGKKVLHFSIIPSKPKLLKAGKKGKTLDLKFSGNTLITGYHVYISTARNFSKKKTSEYTLSGNRFKIKSMGKGTYYIRIRGYGMKKGKAYASGYSKVKKVKIKK